MDKSDIKVKTDHTLNCVNSILPDEFHIETDLRLSDEKNEWVGILLRNGEPIFRTGIESTKPRAIVSAIKIYVTEVKANEQ